MLRVLRGLALAVLAGVVLAIPIRWCLDPPAGGRADTAPDPRLIASLRHLDAAVASGAADDMQQWFPEGFVFTHALVGLSWARVAQLDVAPDLAATARTRARQSADALASETGVGTFPEQQRPPHGVFHAGWSAYLDGQILLATPPSGWRATEVRAFRARCDSIAAAVDAPATPFPTSYPGLAWPADATVAVAALRLHDRLLGERYNDVVGRWVADVRARLDDAEGLLAHAADADTGAPRGGVRGESLALMLRFLPEIDSSLAAEQYAGFRRRFVDTRLGLPVVLATPRGSRAVPDVDSGPVPLGVGLPATVVGIGAARANGDAALADALDRTAEAAGLPVTWTGRRRYGLGLVPVGDAFLVWSRLTEAAPPRDGMPSPVRPVAALVGGLLIVLAAGSAWFATGLPFRRRRRRDLRTAAPAP